jgi:hypothetical protein
VRKSVIVLFVGTGFLYGCVVAPVPPGTVYSQPVYSQPAVVEAVPGEELDYVGETTPLFVAGYDVPFYPRYVIGCECIVPVGFVGGVWINSYGTRIVYDGYWRAPPPHVLAKHHEMIRSNPHAFQRMHPEGRPGASPMARPQQHGPLPAPTALQPRPGQPQGRTALQPRPGQPQARTVHQPRPGQPKAPTALQPRPGQPQQARIPQQGQQRQAQPQQVRAPQQAPARAPAKAPVKKCPDNNKNC